MIHESMPEIGIQTSFKAPSPSGQGVTMIRPPRVIPQVQRVPRYHIADTSRMLQARRMPPVPRCTSFEKHFSLLPKELQLLIIKLALQHELNTPRIISVITPVGSPTQVRSPPFPPLFHVNRLFRLEALRLSQKDDKLVPLLAAYHSRDFGFGDLRGLSRWEVARVNGYVAISSYISKFLRKKKYPGNHLFNPNAQPLELDIVGNRFWLNAFKRLSPALLGRIRYLQLVVERKARHPGVPIWTYASYNNALDRLPLMMPHLELVVLKREDFRLLPVDPDLYGSRCWLLGKKWDDLRVHFMSVRRGRMWKGKKHSDKAMVEYWPMWKGWVYERQEVRMKVVKEDEGV